MKTAFLFPGQGAQTIGMGADLYHTNSAYREAFDACESGLDFDLKAACFEGVNLENGEVVQPAIFTHSLSLWNAIKEAGVSAQAFAGLSLGEYSALAAAGVLTVKQGAALVQTRGRIMDAAFEKGTAGMLSVIGFTVEQVEEIIKDVPNTFVANHLSEAQSAVAGYMPELLNLKEKFEKAGAKMAVLLNVRGPSHAPLLTEASEAFLNALRDEPFRPLCGQTVYSDALGEPYANDADVKGLLALQMRSRLRWHNCVEHMLQHGFVRFVEIGPSNVLTKLLKRRVGKDIEVISVRDSQTLDALLQMGGEHHG